MLLTIFFTPFLAHGNLISHPVFLYLWLSEYHVIFTDLIMCTLGPNFFINYFGQHLAYRDLSNDNNMAKLTWLDFGYELWANTAKDTIKKLDDILTIM